MRHLGLVCLVAAMACKKPADTEAVGVSTPVDLADAGASALVSDRVVDGLVRVRRTGPLNLPIAGDAPSISLDDSVSNEAVDKNGVVEIPASVGAHTLMLNGGQPLAFVSLAGPLGVDSDGVRTEIDAGWGTDGRVVSYLTPAGALGVAAFGSEIMSLEPAGGLSQLAQLDSAILGMRAAPLDSDGVRNDLIAWSASTVVALRFDAGEWVAAGALKAPGLVVASADGGPLGTSGAPAIVVAWANGAGGDIEVWELGEASSLTLLAHTSVTDVPISAAVSTGDSGTLITVTQPEGWWRFSRVATKLVNVSGAPPVALPARAQVWGGLDFDGNGAQELVFASTDSTGQTNMLLLSLDQPDPTYVSLAFDGATLAFGDTNGDARDDMLVLEQTRELKRYSDDASFGAKVWNLGTLDHEGAFAIIPAASGAPSDLVVAGTDRLSRVPGGPGTSSPWRPQLRQALTFPSISPDRVIPYEAASGEAGIGVVAHDKVDDVDALDLYMWTVENSQPKFANVGTWEANDGEGILDAVVCGAEAAVVTTTRLVLLTEEDSGLLQRATLAMTDGARVDCIPDGDNIFFAVLGHDEVRLYQRDGSSVVSRDTVDAPGAIDVALGPSAPGDTGPHVETCDTVGCAILAWTIGNAPTRFVTSGLDGVVITSRGASHAIAWRGPMALGDVDGDGMNDLTVLQQDGMLGVVRGLPDGNIGLPEPTTRFGATGGAALRLLDFDGDGRSDVLTTTIGGGMIAWVSGL